MSGFGERVRRKVLEALSEQPLFADMPPPALEALADQIEWFALGGGRLLFEQGEDSDGMYLLVHGRLGASRRQPDGSLRQLGTIGPGETVGETGLLASQPRNARVVALRDCELLYLPRRGFEELARRHPEVVLRLAQMALRRSYASTAQNERLACFALVPGHAGVDAADFARRFMAALGGDGRIEFIDAARGRDRASSWFAVCEAACRHLVYVGDEDPVWRERCIRQSDCVLVLADARRPAELCPPLPLPRHDPALPVHLVLLQEGDPRPGRTAAWLERLPQGRAHHHVRTDADIDRLVRRLTQKAVGLVLSGGGARGFAHLGVVRALREHGWTFDYVGGTSIGAIIGAGIACDWDDATLHEVYRRAFVLTNPLSDWTLPLVALRSGRSVVRRLREAFGERDIEDLPLPFFCVSSNLTEGAVEVHERGLLWRALRASSAIPGILPPLFHDGQVLVDGGLIDNLPVAPMRQRVSGPIVASDVGGEYRLPAPFDEDHGPPWWKLLPELFVPRRRPGIMQILLRSGMVNSALSTQRARKLCRMLFMPPLEGIELLDWSGFERAVQAGYEYACRRLEGVPPPGLNDD